MSHPMAVTNCNIDMESLIADPNRSIATLVRRWAGLGWAGLGWAANQHPGAAARARLPAPPSHPPCPPAIGQPRPLQAITTLLKTGNESSIDRLLKQIGGFMGEIADEFKVVVVEAIKALCLKFPQASRCSGAGTAAAGRRHPAVSARRARALLQPRPRPPLLGCALPRPPTAPLPVPHRPVLLCTQKYRGLMNFLSNVLREDGGFEYKKAIVDAILVGGWGASAVVWATRVAGRARGFARLHVACTPAPLHAALR